VRLSRLPVWALLVLMLGLSARAEQAVSSVFMRTGSNALAPFRFIQFCIRKPARCTPTSEIKLVGFDIHRDELEQINNQVNRAISREIATERQSTTFWHDQEKPGGHCHHYALAKRSRLLDRGYPSSALLLAIAITPKDEHHLVLIVVTDQGEFVLDNLLTSIVRWDKLPYRWLERSTPKNPQYWQTIVSPEQQSKTGNVLGGISDAG